jgi:drug/metabolite transporter (DMT)-like permease
MTMMIVCSDASAPATGAVLGACSAPIWVDSGTVVQGLFDGISMADAGLLAVSVIGVWAIAFAFRAMAQQLWDA